MIWRDEDPGLPIKFGPCSNGEYDPEPRLPRVLRETLARAREDCDHTARRLGMSRRESLLSPTGAATTPLALHSRTRAATRAPSPRSTPGGTCSISPSAPTAT